MRWLVFYFLVFLTACSSNKQVPKGILDPDVMQMVVFDLLRADEFLTTYKYKDTTLNKREEAVKMYEQVFRIYKTTKDQFYKSYAYYQEHPDLNKTMFDSLYNRANKKKIDSILPPAIKK